MGASKETPDEKAWRVAFETAWRLVTYGRYGGTEKGALKAMKRRLRPNERIDLEHRLAVAIRLANRADEIREKHAARLAGWWASEDPHGLDFAAPIFKKEFPDLPLWACLHMLHLSVDWHLRR